MQPTPNGKRDTMGRFADGNAGGPGNPHAGTLEKYRAAIIADTPVETFLEVWQGVVKSALEGDFKSRKLVIERLLGKAVQPILTDRAAGDVNNTTIIQTLMADPRALLLMKEFARLQAEGESGASGKGEPRSSHEKSPAFP